MVKHYEDDKIEYIKEDVTKIQKKLGMYISYTGGKGALHLSKELINNAIDEAISKKSPGDSVDVIFDEKINQITVIDNGRGIPFDMVELVCTKIQAGSKFDRDSDKVGVENKAFTAGENGVGITAVNALSRTMIFTIFRDGEKGIFIFEEGHLKEKHIEKANKKDMKHGTIVSFIPSEKYLGKCKIILEDLKQWITNISYLIDPSIKLAFHYTKARSEVMKTIKFSHDEGMRNLLDEALIKKPLLNQSIYIDFKGSYHLEEDNKVVFNSLGEKDLGNDMVIQVAFNLNPNVHMDDDAHYRSFCNYVNTIDHGVHVKAAKAAWCKAVMDLATENLSESEQKKLQINFDDCRSGLFATVNLMVDNPQFASQTKEKISNEELYSPIRRIIFYYLREYFRDNPSVAKKVLTFAKNNAKARIEVGKIRKSEYRPVDNLTENTMNCFNPANGDGYKELFIVEGKSAKGSLVLARDAKSQALFALRGVPKNSMGVKLVELLTNQEFKYLIKVLGCGIGKDFDINKLKYDKIIIFTDSDIDGFRIASLICTFFLTQYPDIVKEGLLYKAVAPLYIIEDSKHPYILNKTDYYHYFAEKLVKIIEVFDEKDNKIPSKRLEEFIIKNNRYLPLLEQLVNYYSVSPDILEFVVEFKEKNSDEKTFNKILKKHFPEMEFENNTVKGVYKGSYQYLILDKTFYQRSKGLKELINSNGTNIFSLKDGDYHEEKISLGKLLRYSRKYIPVTKSRLKGLGEMNAHDLWASSLNPLTRELIQLSTDDIEKELERFQTLHGKSSDARKALMEQYVLDINDIDN